MTRIRIDDAMVEIAFTTFQVAAGSSMHAMRRALEAALGPHLERRVKERRNGLSDATRKADQAKIDAAEAQIALMAEKARRDGEACERAARHNLTPPVTEEMINAGTKVMIKEPGLSRPCGYAPLAAIYRAMAALDPERKK